MPRKPRDPAGPAERVTFHLGPTAQEELIDLAREWGCTRSEAVERAVREVPRLTPELAAKLDRVAAAYNRTRPEQIVRVVELMKEPT